MTASAVADETAALPLLTQTGPLLTSAAAAAEAEAAAGCALLPLLPSAGT